ncbi:DUF1716 domain-containing protein [Aphelenchoides avenae]|nr:DUF1716 domain-containing protein [Aphelenchus avenae]
MDTEEFYIEKLNNGLYTLQRVVLVLAEVCCNGPVQCRDRAEKLFKMKLKNPSLIHHIGPVLHEFHENLGDDADLQKQRVESLLIRLGEGANGNGTSNH